MARSIRFVRRGIQGRSRQNFNWPGVISARSVVHITAGEVNFGTTQIQQIPPTQNFFTSSAWRMSGSQTSHLTGMNSQTPSAEWSSMCMSIGMLRLTLRSRLRWKTTFRSRFRDIEG